MFERRKPPQGGFLLWWVRDDRSPDAVKRNPGPIEILFPDCAALHPGCTAANDRLVSLSCGNVIARLLTTAHDPHIELSWSAAVRRLRTVNVLMVLLPACTIAQEHCGYPTSMHRSGFEAGEQPPVAILPPENTPVSIAISGPADNSTTAIDSLQVFGTYTGPANTGIVVNGTPAITNGAAFVTPRLQLQPGANTLTIQYATLDNAPVTTTRTVTYNPALGQAVLLTASSPGDYAPVRMQFFLSTQRPPGQTQVSRVQIDYQDDGIFEVDSTQPAPLEFAYEQAGAFAARARVHFDDGMPGTPAVIVDDTTRIVMQDLAFSRQTLCAVYYGMKHRLQAGQQALALNALLPAIRPRFSTLWTSLQQAGSLSTVASRLGDIADGQFARSTVEFLIAMPTLVPGQFNGYRLVMRKDVSGVWRIANM